MQHLNIVVLDLIVLLESFPDISKVIQLFQVQIQKLYCKIKYKYGNRILF